MFSSKELQSFKHRNDIIEIAQQKGLDISDILQKLNYEESLHELQVELVNLQHWVYKNKLRVAILFEGRDAAGKGGAIKRFTEFLNPRTMRIVALDKPTTVEKGQWYFRRYIKQMPNPGEIVFFDRSWYNRAVVEPIMGFCTKSQYQQFMVQVPEFEHMLYEDGIILIKFWFSITKDEQLSRINSRQKNPLKIWKVSPIDMEGQKLWDKYSYHKDQMFTRTHSAFSPWIVVRTNDKMTARLESMRYVLSKFEYEGKNKSKAMLLNDPNVVFRFYRHSDSDINSK